MWVRACVRERKGGGGWVEKRGEVRGREKREGGSERRGREDQEVTPRPAPSTLTLRTWTQTLDFVPFKALTLLDPGHGTPSIFSFFCQKYTHKI